MERDWDIQGHCSEHYPRCDQMTLLKLIYIFTYLHAVYKSIKFSV